MTYRLRGFGMAGMLVSWLQYLFFGQKFPLSPTMVTLSKYGVKDLNDLASPTIALEA